MKYLVLAITFFIFLSCQNSSEKRLIGEWYTSQQTSGVSASILFSFQPQGEYTAYITLAHRGDIIADTTQGVWQCKGASLYIGTSKESLEPSSYLLTNDTLTILLNGDSLTFLRQ